MMLWVILTLICCVVTMVLTIPLVRRYELQTHAKQHAVDAYRVQISEVERDRMAGAMSTDEANAATIELKRRMLAASDQTFRANPLSDKVRLALVPAVALGVAVASTIVYGKLGSSSLAISSGGVDLPMASAPAALTSPANPNLASVDELTEKLRARLAASPQDAEGWRMLGWSSFNTQNYEAAVEAFTKALALQPANLEFKASLAEAMVQAEKGIVLPNAKSLFTDVIGSDPTNQQARFYLALALEQAGADGEALKAWQALVRDAASDVPWRAEAEQHIAALGQKTGTDVSADLKSGKIATIQTGIAPDISKDQVAAVQALPAEDQQAMIAGMVERLASRLKSTPKDAEGWVKLIRARSVMNDQAAARAALTDALLIFAEGSPERDGIVSAARELGILAN